MTRPLPYFAYGSNLNPVQMAERCPGHRVLGLARLDRHTIRFRGYGRDWKGAVATVEPRDGATVWGVLYVLTPEHYATLDEYEGYDGPGAPSNLYDRAAVTVVREADGTEVRALTYIMRPDSEGRPSRAYRDTILAGMRHHALPSECVVSMESVQTAD